MQENEITTRLKIVTVVNDKKKLPEGFMSDLETLDRAYPEIDIEYEQIEGNFGPVLINELSARWKVPTNFMFISSPSDRLTYRISELKGVRLIM